MKTSGLLKLWKAWLVGIMLTIFASASQAVVPDSVIIDFTAQKYTKFQITLLSHVGPTWTYEVKRLTGHALSHWVLGIGNCKGHVVDTDPDYSDFNTDPTTNLYGIKWNTNNPSDTMTFVITLDGNYQEGQVQVAAKASNKFGIGTITGPDCDKPADNGGNNFELRVDKTGNGQCTVTSVPPGINCGADCQETYAKDTVVNLTVTPDAGSVFAGWSGNCSEDGTVIMDADKQCTATCNEVPEGACIVILEPADPYRLSCFKDRTEEECRAMIGQTHDGREIVNVDSWLEGRDCPSDVHLLVNLTSFTATAEGNTIRVNWTTASEQDVADLAVWRAVKTPNGGYTDITPVGNAAPRGTLTQGASYSIVDSNVSAHVSYYYWLEERNSAGKSIFYFDRGASATVE
jgi:hypothetical protein